MMNEEILDFVDEEYENSALMTAILIKLPLVFITCLTAGSNLSHSLSKSDL